MNGPYTGGRESTQGLSIPVQTGTCAANQEGLFSFRTYVAPFIRDVLVGILSTIFAISVALYITSPTIFSLIVAAVVSVATIIFIVFIVYAAVVRRARKRLPWAHYQNQDALISRRLRGLVERSSRGIEYMGVAATFIFDVYDECVKHMAKGSNITVVMTDPGISDQLVNPTKPSGSMLFLEQIESKTKTEELATRLLAKIPRTSNKDFGTLESNLKTVLGVKNTAAIVLASAMAWASAWADSMQDGNIHHRLKLYFTQYTPYKVWFVEPNICLRGNFAPGDVGTSRDISEFRDDESDEDLHKYYDMNTRRAWEAMNDKTMGKTANDNTPKQIYDNLVIASERILGITLAH